MRRLQWWRLEGNSALNAAAGRTFAMCWTAYTRQRSIACVGPFAFSSRARSRLSLFGRTYWASILRHVSVDNWDNEGLRARRTASASSSPCAGDRARFPVAKRRRPWRHGSSRGDGPRAAGRHGDRSGGVTGMLSTSAGRTAIRYPRHHQPQLT